MTYSTREDWLTAGVEELRPLFAVAGKPLPQRIRVSCGFPLDAKRSKAIGQCWADTASADKTIEILISPVLDKPVDVFEVLVHELCHATAGAMNHGVNFQKIATQMKLEPHPGGRSKREPWKSTRGASDFLETYADIINSLDDYPHAALTYQEKKTQTTRLLKAYCPSCGYTVRLTQKWADIGMPTCPCGDTLTV